MRPGLTIPRDIIEWKYSIEWKQILSNETLYQMNIIFIEWKYIFLSNENINFIE